jgi:hypothetical protein
MRPQDASLGEGCLDVRVGQPRRAKPEGPFRGWIVLRLDGAEPRDDVGGTMEFGSREPLIVKTAPEKGLYQA